MNNWFVNWNGIYMPVQDAMGNSILTFLVVLVIFPIVFIVYGIWAILAHIVGFLFGKKNAGCIAFAILALTFSLCSLITNSVMLFGPIWKSGL